MYKMILDLTEKQFIDLINLEMGVFKPLVSYVDYKNFQSIAHDNRLLSGEVFPFPITLRSDDSLLKDADRIFLNYQQKPIALLEVHEFIEVKNLPELTFKIFGTDSSLHPGANSFLNDGKFLISGDLHFIASDLEYEKLGFTDPKIYRNLIEVRGWKSTTSFQTRNVPHRAHEYLINLGLEVSDGLLLQPVVGVKKNGEFQSALIDKTFNVLINHYLNKNYILYAPIKVNSLYAGPREALFQAIIRKNYGATKFIVGRDHAGVGNFYGKYEAQDFVSDFETEIGIKFLKLSGPYFCTKCDSIVTSKCCSHSEDNSRIEISGSAIRSLVVQKKRIPIEWMREEISEILFRELDVFVNE
jgi:sulfate adenylyltransferase